MQDIREALDQLDSMEDEHWTKEGDPMIAKVSELAGRDVKRQEIVDTAPHFNRENPVLPDVDDEEQEQEQTDEETSPVDYEEALQKLADVEEPMRQQEMLAFLSGLPDEALPDAQTFLEQQLQAADENLRLAEEMRQRAHMNVRIARSAKKQRLPDMDNQQAIREYLRNQHQVREEKFAAVRGMDLSKLDPRAAIDRAMARSTGRGKNRPKR